MMTQNAYSDRLVKGEELLAQGQLAEALEIFEAIIAQDPTNAAALNNAGAALWQLNHLDKAAAAFEQVLILDPSSETAFFNLIDLLLEAEAMDVALETYARFTGGIADSDQKRRYAAAFESICGDTSRPGSTDVDSPPVRSGSDLRVAFVCGENTSFVTAIEDEIAARHTVRKVHFAGRVNLAAVQEAMDWADVTWFEWCEQILIHSSRKLRKTSAVICRIHSYEVFTPLPTKVNWNFVDKVVFVADHIKEAFESKVQATTDSVVIQNGVDVDKLAFRDRSRSHDIAYVGYINYKKNPELLLQCMAELVRHDPAYRLHIAGEFQDDRYRLYFEKLIPEMGLHENVVFDGWIDNIDAWLEDKSYLISTSVLESFGMGIAEGMAKGLKPVIHNWVGAEHVYPRKYLFNTVREFADLVLEDDFNSAEYRSFIESRYAHSQQVDKIDAVIAQLAKKRTAKTGGDGSCVDGQIAARVTIAPQRNDYDRPDRTVIVTGIPRSGTSLFSVLMNKIDNAACLNEILYDVDALPRHFAEIRRRIAHGEPIPNKYRKDGALTTNTQEDDVAVRERIIEGADINVAIGSKINVPYLVHLPRLIEAGYKIVAIVRDPVFTIGSWASEKSRVIPEAQVTDDNLNPRWASFPFSSRDRYERQAEIWNNLASLIWQHRGSIKVYTYEDLVGDTERVMADFCAYVGLTAPGEDLGLQNMNDRTRYANLNEIEAAVRKYCPSSHFYGYRNDSVYATE